MPRFLFQPDHPDSFEFHPIPIDIHLGIINIPTEDLLHDDVINKIESIVVGTGTQEPLNRLQTVFAREYQRYGKLRIRYSTHGLYY